ncbi:MAG: hypothetical protein KF740_10480 [Ramlibacter sp.]|nr:hypothetical protein [Ramlibacter sp.]
MTWLDIGRLHASSGNLLGASRAVRTAHGLAPNSRTVLRSTSRFYLHAREPEQALHVLDEALRTANDPWLMAGHIAISSILRKKSKFIKKARQLVEAGGVRPRELTELASALASLELEAGSIRSARKLFNVALQDPNENSLAQAEWAVSQLNIEPSLPLNWLEGPEVAEASYYRDIAVGDFSAALKDAVRWHDDEPFASRPMLGASFIAGVVGKFDEASSFARQGLLTEPTNIALLNNLAFSTGAQGNISGAEKIVRKIVSLEQPELSGHTIANLGMLAYLRGELSLADSLYEEAMANFRRAKRFEEVAIAGAYKAVFARRANAGNLEKAMSKARELAENSKSNLAISLFKLLLASPIENTAPASIAVPPRKWHYDSSKNVLTFDPPKPLG